MIRLFSVFSIFSLLSHGFYHTAEYKRSFIAVYKLHLLLENPLGFLACHRKKAAVCLVAVNLSENLRG